MLRCTKGAKTHNKNTDLTVQEKSRRLGATENIWFEIDGFSTSDDRGIDEQAWISKCFTSALLLWGNPSRETAL